METLAFSAQLVILVSHKLRLLLDKFTVTACDYVTVGVHSSCQWYMKLTHNYCKNERSDLNFSVFYSCILYLASSK